MTKQELAEHKELRRLFQEQKDANREFAEVVARQSTALGEIKTICENLLCALTGYSWFNLDKAMEESAHPESPYHDLYTAITKTQVTP